MGDFFSEGGWGMYPVLVWALILVVSAGRFVFDGDPRRLHFIGVAALAELAFIGVAVTTNVAAVFKYLESPERVPEGMFWRILVEGLKESSRPAILGLGGLAIALSLAAVGVLRMRTLR